MAANTGGFWRLSRPRFFRGSEVCNVTPPLDHAWTDRASHLIANYIKVPDSIGTSAILSGTQLLLFKNVDVI
jgi:hypothetical protein